MDREQVVDHFYSLRTKVKSEECPMINILIKTPSISIVNPIGEVEFFITYLNDFNNNLVLRLPDIKSREASLQGTNINKKQRRLDAIVSLLYQHYFDLNRAFGEAKIQGKKSDPYDLVRELVRICTFSKEVINYNQICEIFGFQAVGNLIMFYVTSLNSKKKKTTSCWSLLTLLSPCSWLIFYHLLTKSMPF